MFDAKSRFPRVPFNREREYSVDDTSKQMDTWILLQGHFRVFRLTDARFQYLVQYRDGDTDVHSLDARKPRSWGPHLLGSENTALRTLPNSRIELERPFV